MAEFNPEDLEAFQRIMGSAGSTTKITVDQLLKLNVALGQVAAAEKAKADAEARENQRRQTYATAALGAISATQSFGGAMLSTTQGLAKYNTALKGAGDAALKLGENFGTFGKAMMGGVKAVTMMAEEVVKQTDRISKGFDQLAQVGASARFTATQMKEMANEAGLSTYQMEAMGKAAAQASEGFVNAGGSVGEGMKKFGKVLTNNMQEFRQLGFSVEEVMDMNAMYMKQTAASGLSLNRPIAALQKSSEEYIKSLVVLADITGISVKEQQAAVEFSRTQREFQAKIFNMDMEARRLEKSNDPADRARAEDLRKQVNSMRELPKAIAEYSKEQQVGIMKTVAANGAITSKEAAAMRARNFEFDGVIKKIKQGADATELQGEVAQQNAKSMEYFSQNLGKAAELSGDVSEAYAVDEKNYAASAKYRDRDMKAAAEESKKGLEAQLKGRDKLMGFVSATERAERRVQQLFDSLVEKFNPFMSGLAVSVISYGALFIAATKATAALNALAAAATKNAIADAAGGGPGGAGPLEKAAKYAKYAKYLKIAGTVATVGTGAYGAYEGYGQAAEKEKAGEITAAEASAQKGKAVGGGAGAIGGGLAGMSAGGVAGTYIGGLLGGMFGAGAGAIPGAAIGGAIGTALGGWLGGAGGEKVGELAGEKIGTAVATSPDIEAEQKKKAEQEKQRTDALKKQIELEQKLQKEHQKTLETLNNTLSKIGSAIGSFFGGGSSAAKSAPAAGGAAPAAGGAAPAAGGAAPPARPPAAAGGGGAGSGAAPAPPAARPPAQAASGGGAPAAAPAPPAARPPAQAASGGGAPSAAPAKPKRGSGGDYKTIAAAFLAHEEGLPRGGKAYVDAGNTAIGYGHNVKDNEFAQGFILAGGQKIPLVGKRGLDTVLTKEQSIALLAEDLPKYEQAAAGPMGGLFGKLAAEQKAALISYAYNVGSTKGIAGKGLKDAIAAGDAALGGRIIAEKGIKTSQGKPNSVLAARREKEGQLFASADFLSAAKGGFVDGPKSGFPAMLHGKEMITPLKPDSILEKLANTTTSVAQGEGSISVNKIESVMRNYAELNQKSMSDWVKKLDRVIDVLEHSHNTQEKLLRASR